MNPRKSVCFDCVNFCKVIHSSLTYQTAINNRPIMHPESANFFTAIVTCTCKKSIVCQMTSITSYSRQVHLVVANCFENNFEEKKRSFEAFWHKIEVHSDLEHQVMKTTQRLKCALKFYCRLANITETLLISLGRSLRTF